MVANLFERCDYNVSPSWPVAVEAYVSHRLELQLRFGIVRVNENVPVEFHSVFKRANGDARSGEPDLTGVSCKALRGDRWEGVKEMPMFVYVLQRVEYQKRFQPRAVPSVIRLKILESVPNVVGNSWESVARQACPVVSSVANGELSALNQPHIRERRLDDLECEVIERDSHVMQSIADHESPLVHDRQTTQAEGYDILTGCTIVLCDEYCRVLFNESARSAFESFEMSLRPC
jgi:hypothetical protein